jgi:hypothetical protein
MKYCENLLFINNIGESRVPNPENKNSDATKKRKPVSKQTKHLTSEDVRTNAKIHEPVMILFCT